MPGSVLLLGGTDVTLAVADSVISSGARLRGIVTVGDSFSISYSDQPVHNVRSAELSGWAQRNATTIFPFTDYDDILASIARDAPDLCLVAGWYHMVPRRFRSAFCRGCFGFHASLLPQLRGGAPLNWSILSDLDETGVTLFEMGDGVDDGLVFGQSRFPIRQRTTVGDLVHASRIACAALTKTHLPSLLAGTAKGHSQSGTPSYGLQRVHGDGRINWSAPANDIDRLVRAVSKPYPGAFTMLGDDCIRVWSTEVLDIAPVVHGAPGQIARLPESPLPCVVTGQGVLVIVEATGVDGGSCLDKLRKAGHKRFTF